MLLRTLHPISDRGINISEIVSRPLRQGLGEYCFLLTLDRHEARPGGAATPWPSSRPPASR